MKCYHCNGGVFEEEESSDVPKRYRLICDSCGVSSFEFVDKTDAMKHLLLGKRYVNIVKVLEEIYKKHKAALGLVKILNKKGMEVDLSQINMYINLTSQFLTEMKEIDAELTKIAQRCTTK